MTVLIVEPDGFLPLTVVHCRGSFYLLCSCSLQSWLLRGSTVVHCWGVFIYFNTVTVVHCHISLQLFTVREGFIYFCSYSLQGLLQLLTVVGIYLLSTVVHCIVLVRQQLFTVEGFYLLMATVVHCRILFCESTVIHCRGIYLFSTVVHCRVLVRGLFTDRTANEMEGRLPLFWTLREESVLLKIRDRK